MSNNKIKIAIAGIGTVGKGLLELLQKYKNNKINLEVSAIASRRKHKFQSSIFKKTIFLSDAKELLHFEDYDILVELIGGDEGVSKKIVFDALKKKNNVVTANKALVSKYWRELHSLMKKMKYFKI